MMTDKPLVIISYAAFDDDFEQGSLSRFGVELSRASQFIGGEQILIFDKDVEIEIGEHVQERISQSINHAMVLVAILTPSFFTDPTCRDILNRFQERESELGRKDLVLPVHYKDVSDLANPQASNILADRQVLDWRSLRGRNFTDQDVRNELERLAVRIVGILGGLRIATTQVTQVQPTQNTSSSGYSNSDSVPDLSLHSFAEDLTHYAYKREELRDIDYIKALCLKQGPEHLIKNVFRLGYNDILGLSYRLGVHVDEEDEGDEENIVEEIVRALEAKPSQRIRGMGFRGLRRKIKYIKGIGGVKGGNLYENSAVALDHARKLAQLLSDVYRLYAGVLLYNFLNEKERSTVVDAFTAFEDEAKRQSLDTIVEQLAELDEQIKADTEFQEELQRTTGNRIIFDESDLDLVRKAGKGQRKLEERGDTSIAKKLNNNISQFLDRCTNKMPKLIFPVYYWSNIWNTKCVSYIDEEDLDENGDVPEEYIDIENGRIKLRFCKSLYFFEVGHDFKAYHGAYLLNHSREIIYDPKIYYVSYLRTIHKEIKDELSS
jgi:hypothetical protein